MTDRELNAAMARLCEIDVQEGVDDWAMPNYCVRNTGNVWDPAGEDGWNQVHDYVIPALRELGCDIYQNLTVADGMWIAIDKVGGTIATAEVPVPPNAPPPARAFCEVALKVWEKLETDSAK